MSKLEAKSIVVVNGKEIPVRQDFDNLISSVYNKFVVCDEVDNNTGEIRQVIFNSNHIEYVKSTEWQQQAPMSAEEIAKRMMR